jgi:hypothetical protein
MRRALLALLIMVGAAGCGSDEPKFGGTTLPVPARPPAHPGTFDPASVRGYYFFEEPDGQRREIHFVASGPRSTHLRQATQCVDHFLEQGIGFPFCFAYPSERAWRHVHFKPGSGDYSPNCWDARAQKTRDGQRSADRYIPENLGNEGCPDLRG